MNVTDREFQAGDEVIFQALNEAWIRTYFKLEDKDREILGDPKRNILDCGGHIYFAIDPETGSILGCCALVAIREDAFEVAKMVVQENRRGQGIGRKLLRAVINAARSLGANYLYLETNDALQNAIDLYRSEGFTQLQSQDMKPLPHTRVNVVMDRHL